MLLCATYEARYQSHFDSPRLATRAPDVVREDIGRHFSGYISVSCGR